MIELSNKRMEQILHEETQKTEDPATILRGIYTRYMRMYEEYFADIDALNDAKIAELQKYNEETRSLVKYYYMDIPQEICSELTIFDKEYNAKLLGADWHKRLFDVYHDFKAKNGGENKSEKCLKAEFSEYCLTDFYEVMDSIFRFGFGTGNKTVEKIVSAFAGSLFGGDKK